MRRALRLEAPYTTYTQAWPQLASLRCKYKGSRYRSSSAACGCAGPRRVARDHHPAAATAAQASAAPAAPGPEASAAPAAPGPASSPGPPVPPGRKVNFHLVLHSVYKNPPDADMATLRLLESLTLQRLHELSGDSLLTVLYAFARTSPPPHPPRLLPDPRIAARMEAATLPSVATFTPRQLQHAALSLSRLRHNPGEQWLAGFATALEAGWGGFGPVALGETLVAAAEMGLTRLGRVCISEQLPGLVCRMAAEGAMAAASAEAEAVLTGLGRAGTGAGVGLRLQDGGGGSGAGGWGDVRTLVALVWACGHFGCGPPSAQCTQDVLAATWRDIGGGGSSSYAASSSSGNTSSSGSAAAATITHSQSASSSDGGARGDPGRQEPGEEAGGRQGGGAGLCAGDAVLLLHGLACMGVRPPGAWTGRLLGPGGALGPGELGALGVVGLGWAAWSVLKVGEGPPDRAWVDALAGRVVEAVGQELGQGEGGEAEGKEGEAGRGWEGEGGPGDVALALVSLVGLGGHVGACAEVEAYWRGGRRWGALTGAERATLAALGYAPGAGAGAG